MKVPWEGVLPAPGVRTVRDMRSVLADKSCGAAGPLYYMYRDLARSEADRDWLGRHFLRYDITIIPPFDLCGECVKTKGHYHPADPAGTGYPELYEVLEGEAEFLLQSRTLDDVVLVSAKKGACVIIPPGYGHVSINPSHDSVLAMANLVSTAFGSEYGEYETLRGAAYYVMSDGRVTKNPHYPAVPALRRVTVSKDGPVKSPIYSLVGSRDALAFLNEPEKYPALFI